jgi:two-component system sensor histidine kinase TctE
MADVKPPEGAAPPRLNPLIQPPPEFGRREPPSLFGEILDWMLAPLLLLWPMSLAITWLVAQTIANRPYDRELGDRVETLARYASVFQAPGAQAPPPAQARETIERAARVLLRSEDEDEQFFFQVLGARGELQAGDARLAVPHDVANQSVSVRYRDDTVGEEPVRVAYLWLGPSGRQAHGAADSDALVQVAETLGKRSRLATEIVKGVILPQFVILPVAVLLVWLALARGFRPLAELQQAIRRRESHDLSPISEGNVPEEVAPLVRAINELLQRLDKSIGAQRHFLADAAHQLKTPLAGLRTQAELAAQEIDGGRADAATMKHSLRQIALSSQRAAHMVNQLLAMARAEDHGVAIRRRPVDLAAMVREVVRDFVPRAMERRIDLGYDGPDARAQHPRLMGEVVLLGELVRNLVDNALQYTPPGGTVTARVLPDPFGQVVVLQVEDTGPGIAPAERELVFQAFYRALGTQVDGSGLGLAIVQEVAQRHGADVTVEDALPRSGPTAAAPGARFTVRFPLTPPTP